MIVKSPCPGDLTEWIMEPYQGQSVMCMQIEDAPRVRISALLGPDGEPLMVGYERPRIGFDLTPRHNG